MTPIRRNTNGAARGKSCAKHSHHDLAKAHRRLRHVFSFWNLKLRRESQSLGVGCGLWAKSLSAWQE